MEDAGHSGGAVSTRWAALGWLAILAACGHFPRFDVAALPEVKRDGPSDALVLLDEELVRYKAGRDGPAADVTEHRQVQLLRGARLPDIVVPYDRSFSRFVGLWARVVLPDGTSRELPDDERRDLPLLESSTLYSDTRVVRQAVPPMPAGAVLEWEARTEVTDLRPLVTRFLFGDRAPVRRARLVVERPAGWELDVRRAPADTRGVPEPVEEKAGELTRLTWEAKDLPAIAPEELAPPIDQLAPRVLVRPMRWPWQGGEGRALDSPKALSAWLYERSVAGAQPDDAIRAAAAEVLKGVPDEPEAKARALYEYACRAVQYCAIEIGYGGWVPHPAADVQRLRYGDCKDKANHLRALLRVAGIDSDVTLVHAHGGFPWDFEVPALGANFNHAILAVKLPAGTVYADPTWRTVPFGVLPPSDADAPVLRVVEGGAELERTPPAEGNRQTHRISLAVDADGEAKGDFSLEARGANAVTLRARLLLSQRPAKEVLADALGLAGLDVTDARVEPGGDFDVALRVRGTLTARRVLATAVGATALVQLADFSPRWVPALKEELDERSQPVGFRWLNTLEDELTLTLPPGAVVSQLPPDSALDSPFGRYRLAWRAEGGTVRVTRRLELLQRVVPVADYPALRAFFDEVLAAQAAAAVVHLGAAR